MAQPIQTYPITAPGFYGLNTQESSLDIASGFALTAVNCVIDKYGRIGARKGWKPVHVTNAALGSNSVTAIGELITDTGAQFILCAGNNKLFKKVDDTLVELSYGGGGVDPSISVSNWSISTLNECMYFFQTGHDPLVFDPNVSTTTYRRVSEKAGYVGSVAQNNISISAYGRLWTANNAGDKVTVKWSDLLQGHVWATGTAGSLDVTAVWPDGGDNITGLAAHNNFLFIFGRNCILIYSGATDVLTAGVFKLHDTVMGIGCIARDSIQNTNDDVIFLSDTGVQSLQRLVQEKSAPFRDLSKNVRDDLMQAIAGQDSASIKSVYSPFESFYLLSIPSYKMVYCFDMRAKLQDNSSRVTVWEGLDPQSFYYTTNKALLFGKAGWLAEYAGYQDNASSYRFQYFTNHTDLGTPSVTAVLKKLILIVVGGSSQFVTMKWSYDFSSNYQAQSAKIPAKGIAFFGESVYNVNEFASGVNLETLVAYPTGSGTVIQTGYEADINGSPLSIQKIEIHAKNGKVV